MGPPTAAAILLAEDVRSCYADTPHKRERSLVSPHNHWAHGSQPAAGVMSCVPPHVPRHGQTPGW